jgi:hypothetical protein
LIALQSYDERGLAGWTNIGIFSACGEGLAPEREGMRFQSEHWRLQFSFE